MLAFQPDRAAPVLALTNNLKDTCPGNAASISMRARSACPRKNQDGMIPPNDGARTGLGQQCLSSLAN